MRREHCVARDVEGAAASGLAAGGLTDRSERALRAIPGEEPGAVSRPGGVLGRRGWTHLRLLTDFAGLACAAATAFAVSPAERSPHWLSLLLPATVMALLRTRRGAEQRALESLADTTADVAHAVARAAVLALAACAVLATPHGSQIVGRVSLISAAYLLLARVVLMTTIHRGSRAGACGRSTIIIGAGVVGKSLANRLLDDPSYGLCPVGYVDADPLPAGHSAAKRLPLLGNLENLTDAIQRAGAQHVIVAFSTEPDHELVQKLIECERLGIGISVVPRLYESINDRSSLHHVCGVPVLALRTTDPHGWEFAVKHALDRLVAAASLVALAPVLVAIALAVRITSPGPILFRQRRVGRDGHEFTLLKFRTMHEARRSAEPFAPAPGLAPGGVEGADRRTRLGHVLRALSLDELPQFINVLRGDMSLVGPRPERPEFVRKYAHEISRYQNRHRVKSGITGWAQVHGLRGQTSITDRVECDNYYIQNWSLRLDIRILLLTIAQVLRPREDATTRPASGQQPEPAPRAKRIHARSRRTSATHAARPSGATPRMERRAHPQ
jgi:exopolysaccharide biosynthesis polyprenyl glycosylphosphotransferase